MYITYTVQSGDTLYGISRQYGVTVDEIIGINNLSNTSISPGDKLQIYTGGDVYKVVSGDSLYSIAKRFGLTVDELKNLNNLTSNTLKVGQILKLSNVVNDDPNDNKYIVIKGDSLYSIASKYNMTVDELKKLNNLTSNTLYIGQELIIKNNDDSNITIPTYSEYKVVSGDSLYSIANKFNTTVDSLKAINNLKTNNLSIGQILKVQTGEESLNEKECINTNYIEPEKSYITYTVKKGDSLYSIAKNYNVSVNSIISLNNLKTNTLSIGQTLKIKESE